ncbi:hypothetical protein S40288_01451 [Stachybotrys chartarum IBT 40288]|nr:hypothetical protein S40288_01451 [Stachybotrys chartarum IBT 40288]
MSPPAGGDASSPESSRPGGFANVFRGLTHSKSSKSPPPLPASSSSVVLPRAELVNATSTSSRALTTSHTQALELLKNGTPTERIAAANTLKFAIHDYPLNPVLDIWYAAKDLIEDTNPQASRTAGWELLTECVKHPSSTDLERREYFQTISAPTNFEDFHLQLAALVDLTNHGRVLTGFDYELLPLITKWLQNSYSSTKFARKSSRSSKSGSKNKAGKSGEEENFAQLFSFLVDVIKFSFNTADEASVRSLIDTLLDICMSTGTQDDLTACIMVIDAIGTFGIIPTEKLNDCVQVLSSIYCLVPKLEEVSWRAVSNLCKSHNGQATIRILLDILRNPVTEGLEEKEITRISKGALAVLQRLVSKDADKGYPPVPYALLVDGLAATVKATPSSRVISAVLHLINVLFDDGNGQLQPVVVAEDWLLCLNVAAECSRRNRPDIKRTKGSSSPDNPEDAIRQELLVLINRLDALLKDKSGMFIPRTAIVKFFTETSHLLPDSVARTVLEYFQEFRCCSPSDLQWEENLALVLQQFFGNRTRASDIRVLALQTMLDAYDIVDLVGDGASQDLIPRLARSILHDVAEETDTRVLESIMSLMLRVVVSCDMELFEFIVDTLKGIIANERLKSPVPSPSLVDSTTSLGPPNGQASWDDQSPSNVVAKAYVSMFVQVMNFHGEKSQKLFNAIVSVAKAKHCDIDARLTAMKLLFRLRADWAHRIFITIDLEITSLAAVVCRTEASLAKKQADEAASAFRMSHGGQSRAARGVSFGQGQAHEHRVPAGSSSGSKSANAKYQQQWKLPDPHALPDMVSSSISPILASTTSSCDEESEGESTVDRIGRRSVSLNISAWLDVILGTLQGCDWEVYSFVLVHLPAQLSNHAVFKGAIPQIQALRRLVCEQIRLNNFQEPPNASGLRRADVAICLFHSLTMLLSYHEHFQKSEEDEIVRSFVLGISTWERSAKCCIHALSICCHELPLSTSKSLVQMLNQMAGIITQPQVSVHILEFLACLSRMHHIAHFREDEFRIVFAICFRYLEYAREKKQANRGSEAHTPAAGSPSHAGDVSQTSSSVELPQYVHALAYHVILFWFLALKLPERASHVGWIVKKLFADADGTGQPADEQATTSIDFLQRVTYADVDESVEDRHFTEALHGKIAKKRWLVGNSIVTIEQATESGWAQITKRQPSGTSSYTIRETYIPPPPHQEESHVDATREGSGSSVTILPSHLLVQLISPTPQTSDILRSIPLPEDEATERAIRVFDRNSAVDGHKVGVIYIGEGQTQETEILANVSGSRDYVEFLNNLGTLTRLKGATFNTQGLDREYDTDGQHTFCWRDRVTEIVFHVTTQMPTNLEMDPLCNLKKRHTGNDFVSIIFNDSGFPFDFDTFPSQFNFVNIVIAPASRASFIASREETPPGGPDRGQPFYTVQVLSKPGFPEISPASETKMVSLKALPSFIRLLALNASMVSLVWYNREGGEHIGSWRSRLREIKRLRERHATRPTNHAPSPPSTGDGAGQGQQADALRPGSSTVRDSFSSLRRTSVATFFTNPSTGEQASHRSSTLSTSASTNETEVPSNTQASAVDTVDFSKWA